MKKYYIFNFRVYNGEFGNIYKTEISFKLVKDYILRDAYGKIRSVRVCIEENDPYKATATVREILREGKI